MKAIQVYSVNVSTVGYVCLSYFVPLFYLSQHLLNAMVTFTKKLGF